MDQRVRGSLFFYFFFFGLVIENEESTKLGDGKMGKGEKNGGGHCSDGMTAKGESGSRAGSRWVGSREILSGLFEGRMPKEARQPRTGGDGAGTLLARCCFPVPEPGPGPGGLGFLGPAAPTHAHLTSPAPTLACACARARVCMLMPCSRPCPCPCPCPLSHLPSAPYFGTAGVPPTVDAVWLNSTLWLLW